MNCRQRFRLWKRKEKYSLQQRGSLTVECAFVLPLFFLGAVILLSALDLYRVQCILITSLSQSAKELGMYACCVDSDSSSPVGKVSSAACIAYASADVQKRLKTENLTGIVGKRAGISLLESGYRNGIVSLKAVYFYKSPFSLLPGRGIKITAAASAQAWIGYNGSRYGDSKAGREDMVYVTDYESVYHTSAACTHLKLSVTTASDDTIGKKRNAYGEKYAPCRKCMRGHESDSYFYISEKGDCYHSDSACSGLTRHVRLVKESEAGVLQSCRRCQGE